ncbi:23S rRNA (adenine(2030)-N(6))-methyltransferase RlmJ, partial [Enterobacter hormaechei]|uniref:23S rRNA (adenine(2030)-N(6))-methyltransferase RlmJ n=1 Tax=Enterobacter hormaechei TaxID=158836 RepID=UPI000D94E022
YLYKRQCHERKYLGSPLIARKLLREHDRLQLTELHPRDFPLRRSEFQKANSARVDKAEGYQQLTAKLPPVPRRGLRLRATPSQVNTD